MKPIISVDFDGVLHSYSSGWQGMASIPDRPVPGAMQWLADLYESDRVRVAIFSSRSKTLQGRWAMRSWLRHYLIVEFGYMAGPRFMDPLYLEILEWVKWPWFKPAALITLDDRAMTFTGVFPSLDQMLAFKPWNKP